MDPFKFEKNTADNMKPAVLGTDLSAEELSILGELASGDYTEKIASLGFAAIQYQIAFYIKDLANLYRSAGSDNPLTNNIVYERYAKIATHAGQVVLSPEQLIELQAQHPFTIDAVAETKQVVDITKHKLSAHHQDIKINLPRPEVQKFDTDFINHNNPVEKEAVMVKKEGEDPSNGLTETDSRSTTLVPSSLGTTTWIKAGSSTIEQKLYNSTLDQHEVSEKSLVVVNPDSSKIDELLQGRVVIDFALSGCKPCLGMEPSIEKYASKYASQDIPVVKLTGSDFTSLENTKLRAMYDEVEKSFGENHSIGYPMLWYIEDGELVATSSNLLERS